jgi:hypothetical protein
MSWSVISKMVPYTDWTSADQLFARQDLPQQLGRAITDAVAGAAQSVGRELALERPGEELFPILGVVKHGLTMLNSKD